MPSHIHLLSIASALAALSACGPGLLARSATQPQPSFDYRDVARFARAADAVDSGAASDSVFQAYIADGGPGLTEWAKRYDLTAAAFSRAYARYPRYLRYVGTLTPALAAREAEIATGLARLNVLATDALGKPLPLPPTSYFVSAMGGGGSASTNALMIAVDYYGLNPGAPTEEFTTGIWPAGRRPLQPLDGMVVAAVHELAHRYQQIAMGALRYTRMYWWRWHDTLIARAVREGCAELLAELALGKSTPDQLVYGTAREAELWRAFRAIAHERTDKHTGWFSGRNTAFPDAPWQIGYFVGMRMCRAWYDGQPDRKAALRAILQTQGGGKLERAMMRSYDVALGLR